MSAVAKRLLTPQEYLAQERNAPFRSEYLRGEVFAMAGASFEHCLIKDNLAGELRSQLKEGPCRVATSDLRVKVDKTGLYTYPDVVIVCEEPHFEDSHFDVLLNPRAIAEVLSDSTEKYDRGDKFAHYRQIPSLQEYLLITQNRALVERYVRQPNDAWLLTELRGLEAVFKFMSVSIPLAEIYRGVMFPDAPLR